MADYGIDPNGNPVSGAPTVAKTMDSGNGGQQQTQQNNVSAPSTCPSGFVWRPSENKCVPASKEACPAGTTWDGINCNAAAPTTTTTNTGTGSGDTNKFLAGAGWDNVSPVWSSIKDYYGQGITGQALVDKINSQYNLPYGSSLAYYPDNGAYSLPDAYMIKNGQGQYDLIQRPKKTGTTGTTSAVPQIDMSSRPKDYTLPTTMPATSTPITPAPSAPIPTLNPTVAPGTVALPTYDPFQFAKIPDYVNPSSTGLTQQLLDKMLTTTSLSPEVVAQMKEGQKSSLLDMATTARQNALRDAVSRNVLNSGPTASTLSNIDLSLLGNLSKAYRDVDIQKAIQDRTDQQNAVAASNSWQQALINQFLGIQGLNLNQEQAQAGENYKGFTSKQDAAKAAFDQSMQIANFSAGNAKDVYDSQKNANTETWQRWLSEMGLRKDITDQELKNWLALQGLSMTAFQNSFANWATTQGLTLQQGGLNLQGDELKLALAKFLAGE